jgi:tetratricopeptide (TPR) repeat protein
LETLKLMPALSQARADLVTAYTDTGQFDKARQNLNMADLGAIGHFRLATILMYERKDADAIPHLLDALQEDPDEPAFLAQLVIAERHVGRLAESKKIAQRGLALVENPRNASERSLLGYFCAQLGQSDRAQSETKQAFQLDPSNLNVRLTAVQTYEALDMRDDALAVLRTAPPEMLGDLNRWPDLADLTSDTRFREMTAANAEKKEK